MQRMELELLWKLEEGLQRTGRVGRNMRSRSATEVRELFSDFCRLKELHWQYDHIHRTGY